MSDLISRQAAIDALKEHRNLFCDNTPETFSKLSYAEKSRVDELDTAIATLINLPSAQPEIIHCRDCKHWQSEEYIGNNNVHTLNIASLPCKNWLTGGDWYCGSAERKDI